MRSEKLGKTVRPVVSLCRIRFIEVPCLTVWAWSKAVRKARSILPPHRFALKSPRSSSAELDLLSLHPLASLPESSL